MACPSHDDPTDLFGTSTATLHRCRQLIGPPVVSEGHDRSLRPPCSQDPGGCLLPGIRVTLPAGAVDMRRHRHRLRRACHRRLLGKGQRGRSGVIGGPSSIDDARWLSGYGV